MALKDQAVRRGELADDSDGSINVGSRIRDLRERKGLSGRELAARAGVDPAYLSRLENGKVSPTVATLARVMRALGEPVGVVFGEAAAAGPVVKARHRRLIRNRGVDDYLLSPTTDGRLEVIETLIEPGAGSGSPAYSHPGDEECIVVLEGVLHVWLNDERYELEPGDAITFQCRTPHSWLNPGETRARLIWIITPAGY